MNRIFIDRLVSWTGIIIAAIMLIASIGLFYAHDFIHQQVNKQLSAQAILFPAAGSEDIARLPKDDQKLVSKYAGQQLTSGDQAKVFADNYIGVHLRQIAGGQTYSELSQQAQANPSDDQLAGQVATVFRGETLRGLLLNAYAFDTVATIALYGAYGTAIVGFALIVFAYLGLTHAKKIDSPKPKSKKTTSKK